MVFWEAEECCGLEDSAYVPLLVFIAGNEQ
jgi:hypothetical protein